MNGRFVAIIGVFCIAILVAAGAYAEKPENPGKPDKPDKPNVPGQTKAECIVFTGDLASVPGGTQIEGCCLNAGPWPEYTMILGFMWPDVEIDGYLHIGSWLPGPDGGYVVQFWDYDVEAGPPGPGNFMFEIWGGDVVRDRKRKLITVTFGGDDTGTLWGYTGDPNDPKFVISYPDVDFVLERTSDLSFCE